MKRFSVASTGRVDTYGAAGSSGDASALRPAVSGLLDAARAAAAGPDDEQPWPVLHPFFDLLASEPAVWAELFAPSAGAHADMASLSRSTETELIAIVMAATERRLALRGTDGRRRALAFACIVVDAARGLGQRVLDDPRLRASEGVRTLRAVYHPTLETFPAH